MYVWKVKYTSQTYVTYLGICVNIYEDFKAISIRKVK